MATSPVLYVYYPPLNDDSWPGVPGRHITEADWAAFTIAQRRTIENATTQEGYTRRKVWVHIDLVDETEEERAQREAEEAAARAEYDRKNSLVRYGQIETMIDQLEVLPPAEEFAALRADVDAVADVPPRVEAVETKVSRVDPGEYAGAVGESLAQGPNGPAWRKDAVSADWYSNINDAITAAGPGGTVRLSSNTTYNVNDLQMLPGSTLEGDAARTSILRVSGDAGIRTADPSVRTDYVRVRNLTLVAATNGSGVGIDARGMARMLIENVLIEWFEVGVWYGGDSAPYSAPSWTNTFNKGEIVVPVNGSGIRFSGLTTGGASRANNNAVRDVVINLEDAVTSRGIDLQAGDTNLIEHCDVGYGHGLSVPYYLGPKARYNTIRESRSEDVDRAVVIEGGTYNTFFGNYLGGEHASVSPVTITVSGVDNALFNAFIANAYQAGARTPVIDEQGGVGARKVYVNDKNQGRVNPFTDTHTIEQRYSGLVAGDAVLRGKVQGDADWRWFIRADGGLFLGDGTGTYDTRLTRPAADLLSMSTGDTFKVDGVWNGGLLRMGNYRLWVDAAGNLRIKNGAPTSDTDGVTVGSQT